MLAGRDYGLSAAATVRLFGQVGGSFQFDVAFRVQGVVIVGLVLRYGGWSWSWAENGNGHFSLAGIENGKYLV